MTEDGDQTKEQVLYTDQNGDYFYISLQDQLVFISDPSATAQVDNTHLNSAHDVAFDDGTTRVANTSLKPTHVATFEIGTSHDGVVQLGDSYHALWGFPPKTQKVLCYMELNEYKKQLNTPTVIKILHVIMTSNKKLGLITISLLLLLLFLLLLLLLSKSRLHGRLVRAIRLWHPHRGERGGALVDPCELGGGKLHVDVHNKY